MRNHHRSLLALALVVALAGCTPTRGAKDTAASVEPSATTTSVPGDQPSSPGSSPAAIPKMSVPFVLDLSTGAATPLAEGIPTDGRAYAVSPDRTMVATNPCCDPPAPVSIANLDGSDVRVITPNGVDGFGPRWSPDGSKLVYQERDAATEELGNLVVYSLATGERTGVTDLEPMGAGSWRRASPRTGRRSCSTSPGGRT